eukprot:9400961-Alexandrium_andersonii.AAC.1
MSSASANKSTGLGRHYVWAHHEVCSIPQANTHTSSTTRNTLPTRARNPIPVELRKIDLARTFASDSTRCHARTPPR